MRAHLLSSCSRVTCWKPRFAVSACCATPSQARRRSDQRRNSMDLPTATRISVPPTGASLAADIAGVDLAQPVDAATFKAIEDAWHEHLVLRFRGQHLDDPRFLAFARRFGELDKA